MIKDYEIIKEFTSGGQANTFLAENIYTKQKVVIKEVIISATKDWKTIELFERECKTLQNLNHKAIPRYLDAFHEEKDDKKSLYLVQEYIDGTNLSELIASGKRFTLNEVYTIIKQLLNILDYLHSLVPPLVHRDIKPSNILIVNNKDEIEVNLIDFGTVNKSVVGNLGSSTIVGTIGYMASEQLMGKATPKSDIYSVGAVFLFLLTNIEPSMFPIMDMQIIIKDNPTIKELNNKDLNYFINKLIDVKESKRYPNVKEVLNNLKYLENGISIIPKVKKEIIYPPSTTKPKKWESFLFGSLILFGIMFASYVYLINFNRFSESKLVSITPYWISPIAFGIFGSTTKKENKILTALIRTVIVIGVLIFFMHALFPGF